MVSSREEELAPSTRRGYKANIEHAITYIGKIRLEKVKPVNFRKLYKKLKQRKGLSGTTVVTSTLRYTRPSRMPLRSRNC
ncbi:MAG: hypothetical protein C4575_13175 [Desulforudis sp.]|nr:MAG: hypothetical protein C4575_13175 [Desulforudis sp.]